MPKLLCALGVESDHQQSATNSTWNSINLPPGHPMERVWLKNKVFLSVSSAASLITVIGKIDYLPPYADAALALEFLRHCTSASMSSSLTFPIISSSA